MQRSLDRGDGGRDHSSAGRLAIVTCGTFPRRRTGGILDTEVGDVAASLVFWAIPVVLVAALLGHLGWIGPLAGRLWDRVHPTPPAAANVSIEQLAADLRRLAAHLEAAYQVDQPAKMERLTAAALAYDWVLLSACKTLDVTPPGDAPFASVERLQVEAALAARGLDW